MSAELLINVTPTETRIALIENGVLQELFLERAKRRGLVGNVIKGRVSRVLPGMQAAFVDIGLERAAFLHVSDIASLPRRSRLLEDEPLPLRGEAHGLTGSDASSNLAGPDTRPQENIAELITEGQELLVQVIKDPIGTKGARLTTHIAIPSCYVVFMPTSDTVGVSQRIEDDNERQRLRIIVRNYLAQSCVSRDRVGITQRTPNYVTALPNQPGTASEPVPKSSRGSWSMPTLPSWSASASGQTTGYHGPALANKIVNRIPSSNLPRAPEVSGGYIVRTAAEHASEHILRADMIFLQKLWHSLLERAGSEAAPCLVHEELPLVIRTLRELVGTELEKVRIDSYDMYQRVIDFARRFIPESVFRIKHYVGERPIFDLYGVEDEIQKALERKVYLKSGGYLIIDQTEAMTTIDVNTGGYVGHRNLEETIFKTNLEATQAIARQLRLRNLGGIIIIDFIDMRSEEHKHQVLRALEKCLERDHTKTDISEVSSLGLVQMTRKRTRESLEHTLCDVCPTCSGRGSVKTPETVCYEIFREIMREARQYDAEKLLVLASQEVIDMLVDEESAAFAELEALIGKPIKLQVEALYTQEQFDVVPL
ncbi:MAG: Rne/Rng family ribonuclease [Gammaproteobacteria bacterium]